MEICACVKITAYIQEQQLINSTLLSDQQLPCQLTQINAYTVRGGNHPRLPINQSTPTGKCVFLYVPFEKSFMKLVAAGFETSHGGV
jgi:hypothetical protein